MCDGRYLCICVGVPDVWSSRWRRDRKSHPSWAEEEERLPDCLRVQTIPNCWTQTGDAGVYMYILYMCYKMVYVWLCEWGVVIIRLCTWRRARRWWSLFITECTTLNIDQKKQRWELSEEIRKKLIEKKVKVVKVKVLRLSPSNLIFVWLQLQVL